MRCITLFLICLPSILATILNLPTSIHESTSGDLSGIFTLAEDTTKTSLCPLNITHTSWREFNNRPIVQHNFIIVDGSRCASVEVENGGKATTFYNSLDYDKDLVPISGSTVSLPKPLVELINSDGSNINAWGAARAYGEDFLLGFDDRLRICDSDGAIFPAWTTTFLLRPFLGDLVIKNITTPLKTGYKWMLIVPTYKGGSCLYQADLPPLESEEPESIENAETEVAVPEDVGSGGVIDGGDSDDVNMFPSEEPSSSPEVVGVDVPETTAVVEEEGAVCFPAHATVMLKSGHVVRMDELTVGDQVSVGSGEFSPVFGFSHADKTAVSAFVKLSSVCGASLMASKGHFVYVNGGVLEAGKVKVGDLVEVEGSGECAVEKVEIVQSRGLFNPQTLGGVILVDGIKATTFTSAVGVGGGEGLLAPVRAAYRWIGIGLCGMEKGAPEWVKHTLV